MNFPTTDTSGQGQQARAERDVINPATGEVLATVPEQFGNDVAAGANVASATEPRLVATFPWRRSARNGLWQVVIAKPVLAESAAGHFRRGRPRVR